MFLRTKSIGWKFQSLGRRFFGRSLLALMFVKCVLYKMYYTLFLRELLWVPWLMIPYIYGIYVKRDLPYYILWNFAEKGKNLLLILYIGYLLLYFKTFSLNFILRSYFFWDGLYAQSKTIIQNFKRISSENKLPSFPDTSSIPEATA